MTIPPRFSDDQLVDIINATRLRSPIMRDSGPDYDRVTIVIPYQQGSAYRFERDATGWTRICFT
jgi:hypothetical protein